MTTKSVAMGAAMLLPLIALTIPVRAEPSLTGQKVVVSYADTTGAPVRHHRRIIRRPPVQTPEVRGTDNGDHGGSDRGERTTGSGASGSSSGASGGSDKGSGGGGGGKDK